ncbi:SigE family RNA polymerase sigma factor [Nocardioides sp. ChNu-153]|uniref:SigE family RNA polymerase sigma factor n=1 Tax=Nocardioides sp. ChNu-153 TaxID=2779364 RepID=UPI002656562F|nr:SigE family RNA polymerase sigma factor [Nocardioides sp. ChNu-153]MDN7120981.1 SigE family RNA polymerase sigma factor [Nocardioides sp. ChNu-153]
MELEAYVAARRGALVRSAVLLGCPADDAEDLVQTTLARCLRSRRRVEAAENPDAYVYRVLVNTFRDLRARRWHGEVPTEHLPDRPDVDIDTATGLAVRAVLGELPVELREVLVLRYYADLTEREIAAVLGVRPGTVKSRASRALARLATHPRLRSTDAAT